MLHKVNNGRRICFMEYLYRKERVIEVLIAVTINLVSALFIYIHVSKSMTESDVQMAVQHINAMTDTAYKASEAADKVNQKFAVEEIKLNGCSVVNKNGSWYMVYDMNDAVNGSEKVRALVSEQVDGLINASELKIKKFDSPEYSAKFLRFSSAKKNPPSHSKGDFVNTIKKDFTIGL